MTFSWEGRRSDFRFSVQLKTLKSLYKAPFCFSVYLHILERRSAGSSAPRGMSSHGCWWYLEQLEIKSWENNGYLFSTEKGCRALRQEEEEEEEEVIRHEIWREPGNDWKHLIHEQRNAEKNSLGWRLCGSCFFSFWMESKHYHTFLDYMTQFLY